MLSSAKEEIILVDGSSYLFRAYYAIKSNLETKEGFPTSVIFGVLNMFRSMLKTYENKNVIVVFDHKGKNFRHNLFSEYKAKRKNPESDFKIQVDITINLVKENGFTVIKKEGYEADDVIGTLANILLKKNYKVLISTGDKDLTQLIPEDKDLRENITIIDTMNNKIMSRDFVNKRFGVEPWQMIDFLALCGDSSDNIPGVKGCGIKTSQKLLQEYSTLENIYNNLENIKGRAKKNLEENKDMAFLSQDLATIRTGLNLEENLGFDINKDFSIQKIIKKEPNIDYLIKEYKKYELFTFINDFKKKEVKKEILIYKIIDTKKSFESLLKNLEKYKVFAFDTETTGLDIQKLELVGISISYKENEAFYIPLRHKEIYNDNLFQENIEKDDLLQLNINYVLENLKPFLESNKYLKIGQNIKYDIKVMQKENITISTNIFDTMLASYIYNSSATKHNLDDLANFYLHHKTVKFEDIAGKGKKQKTFDKLSIEESYFYACEDADITFKLYNFFKNKIYNDKILTRLFNLELKVLNILNNMENAGIKLDVLYLKEQSLFLEQELKRLEKICFDLSGEEFNLSSPKQLREVLFEKLKIPPLKKTQGGVYSTNEEVLMELADIYELPKILLEYRHLHKLKTTYTDKLPKILDSKNRVHTSYLQGVVITGRLASQNPNLQNIPIKTEIGRNIRRAFIAEENYKILSVDYSQIELRIMAHFSKDDFLRNSFQDDKDIHLATASEIFEIPLNEVTSEQRRQAKIINFSLLYGMGAFGLSKKLQIEMHKANEYIKSYFNKFEEIKNYMEENIKFGEKNNFVETILGRKIYLQNINSKNIQKKKASERFAINAPMQGSSADIIKLAMVEIDNYIQNLDNKDKVKILMQVHDELVFEVREDYLKQAQKDISNIMENCILLNIKLKVESNYAKNWGDSH